MTKKFSSPSILDELILSKKHSGNFLPENVVSGSSLTMSLSSVRRIIESFLFRMMDMILSKCLRKYSQNIAIG